MSCKMVFDKSVSSNTVKAIACLLFLALTISCASSARILNEEIPSTVQIVSQDHEADPSPEAAVVAEASDPVVSPQATNVAIPSITQVSDNPSGAISANIANTHLTPIADTSMDVTPTTSVAPEASVAAITTSQPSITPAVGIAPVGLPAAQPNAEPTTATSATDVNADPDHTLSFFMHDVLGGSKFTAKAVTGIVTNPAVNTVQKLLHGKMTVIDDELTEGHELGSGLVGKAQGFYVVSSEHGSGQFVALTAMFESGNYADSINFFGVLDTSVSESQLGIMGGTGKYVNSEGYATVKTIPFVNHHNTDGLETLLEFTVYLA